VVSRVVARAADEARTRDPQLGKLTNHRMGQAARAADAITSAHPMTYLTRRPLPSSASGCEDGCCQTIGSSPVVWNSTAQAALLPFRRCRSVVGGAGHLLLVQSGRARRYSRRARIVARRSSLRRPSCTAFSRQRQRRRRRCSASSNSAASRVAGQAFVVEDGRSASRAVRARTVAARDWLLDDGDRRSVVVVGSRIRLRQP
jgi:hypothetical protein